MSSAKVLRIVLSDCGISAVYIVYSSGPKMLPWGTPERIENGGGKFIFRMLSRSVCFVSMIVGD